MSDETILIVTEYTSQASDIQRGYREVDSTKGTKVSVNELERNMSRFLHSVSRLFHQAEQGTVYPSGIELDEIELSVEISGEGEIKLIGTGMKAASKGAIKLKFKRSER